MSADRPDLIQAASKRPDSFEQAFRIGSAIVFPWRITVSEMFCAIQRVERYLSKIPVEESFRGTDELEAHRQSFWVASTGLGREIHTELSDVAHLDGDAEGGARGIELLRANPELRDAFSIIKGEIDQALQAAVRGLRLHEELSPECFKAVTVRYRAIRYAPTQTSVAGIGTHPDGNVISALVTDQPGLVVVGAPGWSARPSPEAGIVIMPGSILARWSDNNLLPTVHAVEIHPGSQTKCTIVGFLNFPDARDVPRSPRLTNRGEPFRNEVDKFKRDDMRRDGDLAGFYRDRGFLVKVDGKTRFRTLAELLS